MEDKIQLVCKRQDFKGSALFAAEVNKLFAEGYVIDCGATIREAPRMAGQPRLTFVKKGVVQAAPVAKVDKEPSTVSEAPVKEKVSPSAFSKKKSKKNS
jgi:hypothetical protein